LVVKKGGEKSVLESGVEEMEGASGRRIGCEKRRRKKCARERGRGDGRGVWKENCV
jgi:hypothetical protein